MAEIAGPRPVPQARPLNPSRGAGILLGKRSPWERIPGPAEKSLTPPAMLARTASGRRPNPPATTAAAAPTPAEPGHGGAELATAPPPPPAEPVGPLLHGRPVMGGAGGVLGGPDLSRGVHERAGPGIIGPPVAVQDRVAEHRRRRPVDPHLVAGRRQHLAEVL